MYLLCYRYINMSFNFFVGELPKHRLKVLLYTVIQYVKQINCFETRSVWYITMHNLQSV